MKSCLIPALTTLFFLIATVTAFGYAISAPEPSFKRMLLIIIGMTLYLVSFIWTLATEDKINGGSWP
jgi:hypothetical protein